MTATTQLIHEALFGLTSAQRLSAMVELNPVADGGGARRWAGWRWGWSGWRSCAGGRARWSTRSRANALYGGRMSLGGQPAGGVLQTIMSSGVGASVGLEAGYTQIGSALASRIGRSFRVRRNDLRVLVGCGAADGHRRRLQQRAADTARSMRSSW